MDTFNEKFNLVKKGQSIVLDQNSIFELDFIDSTSNEDVHPMKQSLYTNLEQVQLVNDNVNYNLAL